MNPRTVSDIIWVMNKYCWLNGWLRAERVGFFQNLGNNNTSHQMPCILLRRSFLFQWSLFSVFKKRKHRASIFPGWQDLPPTPVQVGQSTSRYQTAAQGVYLKWRGFQSWIIIHLQKYKDLYESTIFSGDHTSRNDVIRPGNWFPALQKSFLGSSGSKPTGS